MGLRTISDSSVVDRRWVVAVLCTVLAVVAADDDDDDDAAGGAVVEAVEHCDWIAGGTKPLTDDADAATTRATAANADCTLMITVLVYIGAALPPRRAATSYVACTRRIFWFSARCDGGETHDDGQNIFSPPQNQHKMCALHRLPPPLGASPQPRTSICPPQH